jgi:uncharacterized repeat protein (TIGR01451 family)/LPXTG-motif cell wall-anchored protein
MENTMSTLTQLIRRAPKRFSALALIVAAAVIIPTAALAWGPNRQTFTIANPSDHVQFNSITDNPNVGDERNFVGVRDASAANTWYDSLNAESGKTYVVRMYVHNNAATSLNLVANNVTAKVNLPTTTGTSVDITGFIDASNVGADGKSNPGAFAEVYDNAKLTSNQNFNVAYVPGSLKYENNSANSPYMLPESIFTSAGAKLGYNQMDGNIPGCFQYSGYVSFEVKPQFATPSTFSMNKMVSKHSENKWVDNYSAKTGEIIDYLLEYKNTGGAQQDSVTFRDTLPTGMTYVSGSTTFGNSKTPAGVKASDNIANGTGINVGSYAPGANAWAIFSATAPTNDKLAVCGVNTLINNGKVTTGGYSVSDTANITITKECLPDMINVCRLSDKTIVSIKQSDYDAAKSQYSTNLDDCKTVTPPVTPPVLPKTGMSENIVAVVGLGALVASIAYYVASRKALNQ